MLLKQVFMTMAALAALALLGPRLIGEEGGAGGKKAVPASKAAAKKTPVQALGIAIKALAKAESYKVGVDIEGGLSDRPDHEVTETTVREAYEGEVFGALMHVPNVDSKVLTGLKAFRVRNTRKGVAYIDGAWRNILSHKETTLLDRLFAFPEVLLDRALVNGAKAEWVKDEEEEKSAEEAGDDAEAKKAAEEAPKPASGKTAVLKKKPADEGPQPHIVRVEVPPKEALTYFTEVQNSGCMSGG